VAFKVGTAPEKQAEQMLAKGVAAVLMNSPGTMGSPKGEYTFLSSQGHTQMKGSKDAIAHAFWNEMMALI
jgi:hypothetical protein